MTDQKPPSLTHYFGTSDHEKDQIDFTKELTETTDKISSIRLGQDDNSKPKKKEPEVCRIFAEAPVEPKDPTAAFFDLIGNDRSKAGSGGIMSDLGLPTKNEVSYE